MESIKIDTIVDEAGTGIPNFPNGLSIKGIQPAPAPIAVVATEAELDAAIANTDATILISKSFNITTQKTIAYTATIRGSGMGIQLTGVGLIANQAMFAIAASSDCKLLELNLITAQTDIDLIQLQTAAAQAEVSGCILEVPALTTRSCVYVDASRSRVVNNDANCNGSVSTPGCIFEDTNGTDNLLNPNIIS